MRSRTRGLRGRGAVMSFHIYRFPFIHLYTPVTPINSVSNFNSSLLTLFNLNRQADSKTERGMKVNLKSYLSASANETSESL
jgi:hypothetical protein